MMPQFKFKIAAVAFAAPVLAFAAPAAAAAAPNFTGATTIAQAQSHTAPTPGADVFEHKRKYKRRGNNGRGHAHGHDRGHDRGYDRYSDYGQPVYRNTRIWRGRDDRYYCRKEDGTTGLLIGAAVGGLIGNEVAGRGDRTLGAILGAAGGALLGRQIDRSNSRCR